MKVIKQVSTGKTVYRDDPHADYSIHSASDKTGINLSDLEVADDVLTEQQYADRIVDEQPWEVKIALTDSTMPRWFEDYVTENSVVLAPGRAKDNYDAKVALRLEKP